jgi:hypothetical protein
MAKESRVKIYSRKTKKGLTRVKSHLKRNKKKIIAGAATLGALGIGYAALRRKKMLRMENPKIVKPLLNVDVPTPISTPTRNPLQTVSDNLTNTRQRIRGLLQNKNPQSRVKQGFTDSAGKQRKRGQILPGPKKNDVNAKYVQEPGSLKRRVAVDVNTLEILDPEFKLGKVNLAEGRAKDLVTEAKALKLKNKRTPLNLKPKPRNKKDNK